MLFGTSALAADKTQNQDKPEQKVYKSVGPNGDVIYSDKPSPDSQEIEVPTDDAYTPVAPPRGFTPYQPPKQDKASANTISISSPQDGVTIRNNTGDVSVSVTLGKPLQAGQTLVYQMDGNPVYSGQATSYTLKDVYRGTHIISVQISGAHTPPVSSAPVTIYMKRPFKKN